MKTPIERMYRAGKIHIPAQAENVSGMASWTRSGMDKVDVQAAKMGDPAVMRDMLGVCDMVFEALRRGVSALNNCADAVIATADEFVATDTQAKTDFNGLSSDLTDLDPLPAYVPDKESPTEDSGATVSEYDERGREHTHTTDSTEAPDTEPEDDLGDRDGGVDEEDLPEVP